ncbi:flagellar brake domain-containing protein [Bacillota bacterium LX-D]|nr:flagellar brake domain-containing protein [Bacillota bacterium LX-D]
MQLDNILVINRKVELSRIDENTIYKSLIQEVKDDSFAVAVPSCLGEYLILHPNELVNVMVLSDNERYGFVSKVLFRSRDQIPLYYLSNPKEVERIQLRNFVRIKTIFEVFYQEISSEDLDRLNQLKPQEKARVVDISGGGMQIAIDKKIPVNSLLYVHIPLAMDGDVHNVFVVGKIVRFIPADEKRTHNLAGLGFEKITEKERELLIRFIFCKMREQRWAER